MKKSVLLVGPLLTRSGYGEQARFALRSLRSREDLFDIYIRPITWGQTSWITEDNEERRWIDQTIEKTIAHIQQGGQFDMSLQVTIPNEFQALARENVGYTAGIETTHCAALWIDKCNSMNRNIVVSNHSKEVIESSAFEVQNSQTGEIAGNLRSQKDLFTVNYPVKTFDELPDLNLNLKHDFNFLVVAQFGPRKNLENTIMWFLNEFKDEEVGMIVKTNVAKNCLIDRQTCLNNIKQIIDSANVPNRKCSIHLLHGHMTEEEMHSLYLHDKVSAFVAFPHGEGYGLPIFEASYSGLPVVSVGWSGQKDFLYDETGTAHFYEVSYDMVQVPKEAVWKDVIEESAGWCSAREQSAREQMRACYDDIINKNKDSVAYRACNRAEQIKEQFSEEVMYETFVKSFTGEIKTEAIKEEVDDLLADLM